MLIHGSPSDLEEIKSLLDEVGVESEHGMLTANSVGGGSYDVLMIGVGASISLITGAVVAFIKRNSGKRRVMVQWLDYEGECARRVEVESPKVEEIGPLLERAQATIFVTDRADDEAKPQREAIPTPVQAKADELAED